ncbi:hypothetical protein M2302_006612 [Micromonospora sp. A200]|uniref:hypothetical protein n=1 Tax=Micromonospora sp. A200 TaxID=2940568 RepID=UPI0024757874|nr:hypothetical protein [Micromonospora sp. A200]MDH6466404.1 hypothetical protein [Micromonospora sp. A200]
MVLAGCTGVGDSEFDGDVGTTKRCPHRTAYCPAEGAGVSWPGRPSLSPSGKFRLEVFKADPDNADADWQYQVVDMATGDVVLPPPRPGMIGGLGVLAAWDQNPPDTVWVTEPQVTRWRTDPQGTGRWLSEPPVSGEKLPAVVEASLASLTMVRKRTARFSRQQCSQRKPSKLGTSLIK